MCVPHMSHAGCEHRHLNTPAAAAVADAKARQDDLVPAVEAACRWRVGLVVDKHLAAPHTLDLRQRVPVHSTALTHVLVLCHMTLTHVHVLCHMRVCEYHDMHECMLVP